ncbi:GCN5-related N-acetyltransferase 7, chloroplastic isoform X2 [Humulus lupulus]|uniref:GCN5-related N-acetyltransferase 7, chloroplastic isoform X2 n=1 Tax=Humulus lupulus TaxID=3486 RepID=UPI002B41815C|nr:GCN5-related N-acetyltransferase 7, chloroplastic isoform X2 [Humulus lupulus]
MAILSSTPPVLPISHRSRTSTSPSCFTTSLAPTITTTTTASAARCRRRPLSIVAVCTDNQTIPPFTIDHSTVCVAEAFAEDQLWATACLRVRSFYDFQSNSFRIEDHKKHLAEREFEALKERIAGKREDFKRVSCINATVPLSQISSLSEDFCSACKGIGADFARAYLSNVCVAAELHRNGLGYAVVAKSKLVAQEWGISDLYVHVAVENEPAKKLYLKSGFTHESDEPAWQARFLDRPRRILLWTGLPGVQL